MVNIKNKHRHPDVDFLPESEVKIIGTIGGLNLVLLGKQQGTGADVVAHAYTEDFTSEELFAVPLGELLAHSQDKITYF